MLPICQSASPYLNLSHEPENIILSEENLYELGLHPLSEGEKSYFLKSLLSNQVSSTWIDISSGWIWTLASKSGEEKRLALIRDYEMTKVDLERIRAMDAGNMTSFCDLITAEDAEFLKRFLNEALLKLQISISKIVSFQEILSK